MPSTPQPGRTRDDQYRPAPPDRGPHPRRAADRLLRGHLPSGGGCDIKPSPPRRASLGPRCTGCTATSRRSSRNAWPGSARTGISPIPGRLNCCGSRTPTPSCGAGGRTRSRDQPPGRVQDHCDLPTRCAARRNRATPRGHRSAEHASSAAREFGSATHHGLTLLAVDNRVIRRPAHAAGEPPGYRGSPRRSEMNDPRNRPLHRHISSAEQALG